MAEVPGSGARARRDRDRDRDARGRPENARPRDATGRPLDRSAGPSWRERLAHLDAEQALPPQQAIDVAAELIETGQPFYAHEVLEGPWHLAAEPERSFWQGLAQLAVGLTHVQRGNPVGSVTLLRRAAERLAEYEDGHEGVAVARIVVEARALADRVEQAGVDSLQPADLAVRLRP
jgi:uncharacterized protein